jgi:hypothetical protein
MKTLKILVGILSIAVLFSCQKEDNTEPSEYHISGVVYSTTGEPLMDVNVCLEDTVNNVIINSLTDVNGSYSCKVTPGWSGKITPAKVGGYVFEPSQRVYTSVHQNYENQDYNQLLPSKRTVNIEVYGNGTFEVGYRLETWTDDYWIKDGYSNGNMVQLTDVMVNDTLQVGSYGNRIVISVNGVHQVDTTFVNYCLVTLPIE